MMSISGPCGRVAVLLTAMALGSGSIDQGIGQARKGTVYMYAAFGLDAEKWELPYRLQIGDVPPSVGPYVGAGDYFEHATFCPADSSMLCFETKHQYAFAVRKHGVAVGERWEFAGREFRAVQLVNFGIAGRRVDAVAIQGYTDGTLTSAFIYACDLGLVSISEFSPKDKHGVNYLLEGSVGFGSSPDCRLQASTATHS